MLIFVLGFIVVERSSTYILIMLLPVRTHSIHITYRNLSLVSLTDIDHRACDPLNPDGCTRCAHPTTSICCDIHHPTVFIFLDSSFDPPPKLPNRSHLKKFIMGSKEYELSEALEEWREMKTCVTYGESHLIDIGPSIVMPDDVLDRIVACGHYRKIKTLNDLRQETHWNRSNQFGSEVIALIHRIVPHPVTSAVFTTAPLQPRSPQTSLSLPGTSSNNLTTQCPLSVTHQSRKKKCTACGLEGHNSLFFFRPW